LVEEEGDGIRVRGLGEVAGFGVSTLRESCPSGSWEHRRLRDFGRRLRKEAVEELGAGLGVTKTGGDAEDLEFGAAEGESDGEGIIDVVAIFGVDDDLFGEALVGRIGLDRPVGKSGSDKVGHK